MRKFSHHIIITLGLLAIWQGIVWIGDLPEYILPSPLQVFKALCLQYQVIAIQSLPTLLEIFIGFILGILFGCLAALIIAYFHPLKRWFLPILIISQAIPTFAIAPLLVIWFGYGMTSKIATTVLMIFFPVASAFHDGLARTYSGWLDLANTMNAKKWRVFCYIRIPAALPSLASGIRIAAVIAPIGAIIGEWVGSSRGLGYLMLNANARMQIDVMFAVIAVVVLLSLAFYFSINRLLHKLIWWEISI